VPIFCGTASSRSRLFLLSASVGRNAQAKSQVGQSLTLLGAQNCTEDQHRRSKFPMSRYSSLMLPLAALIVAATVPAGRAITVPTGSTIVARLDQPVSTRNQPGSQFACTLVQPVVAEGKVVLPRGSRCQGTVIGSKQAGRLKGRARIALRLDAIKANGRVYSIATTGDDFAGKRRRGHNLRWIGGGGAGGTVIGAIAGGGAGALIGAAVGAGAGTAGAAATSRRNLTLACETPIKFQLAKPLTVNR